VRRLRIFTVPLPRIGLHHSVLHNAQDRLCQSEDVTVDTILSRAAKTTLLDSLLHYCLQFRLMTTTHFLGFSEEQDERQTKGRIYEDVQPKMLICLPTPTPCLWLAADTQFCGSPYKQLASSLRVPSGHAFPIAETLKCYLEQKAV